MSEYAIEVKNVSFTYAGSNKPSIKKINLKIKKGEFVGILGPCGAGKTTLCYTFNGLIPHFIMGDMKGDVLTFGINTKTQPVREIARIVGFVFDNPEYQLTQMTVEEEVAFALENRGVPREEMIERIRKILEVVGLTGLEKRSPYTLSGGQQQRLAIAAALAVYPDILILDEPTSNLDPIGKDEVYWATRKLNKELGMTIIMADHMVEPMAVVADRIVVMNAGEVILDGTPRQVFKKVEVFREIGVHVPQVTELAWHLQKVYNKWDSNYPIRLEEAVEVISKKLGLQGELDE